MGAYFDILNGYLTNRQNKAKQSRFSYSALYRHRGFTEIVVNCIDIEKMQAQMKKPAMQSQTAFYMHTSIYDTASLRRSTLVSWFDLGLANRLKRCPSK